jgi:hypothetical protein
MHFYNSVVGIEAVKRKFNSKERKEEGLYRGVTRFLYLAAFVLHEGESLGTVIGGSLPDFIPVIVSAISFLKA